LPHTMMSIAGPVAVFTGIFSGVVVIHEAGHFLAARRCRVPVAEFSIGFPGTPVVLKLFRHRETTFTLRLLPFGGFVRLGDVVDSGDVSGTDGTTEPVQEDNTEAFEDLPPCKKAIILVAGSLVNLVAGACLMVATIMITKGLDFLEATTAVTGLMGMVIKETLSALTNCNVNGIVGPVGAAGITRDVLARGLWPLVGLSGLMSISVGIMNLLPVPGFDGWHLGMAGIEAATGKPLSGRFQAMACAAGFAVVVVLMVVVTYHDVTMLLSSCH
jgi:regulator of sigma E protease